MSHNYQLQYFWKGGGENRYFRQNIKNTEILCFRYGATQVAYFTRLEYGILYHTGTNIHPKNYIQFR